VDSSIRTVPVGLSFNCRAVLARHFSSLVPDGHKHVLANVLFRSRDYYSLPDHRQARVRDYAVQNISDEAVLENCGKVEPEFRASLREVLAEIGAGSEFEPASEKFFDDAVEHFKTGGDNASVESQHQFSVIVPVNLRRDFLEKHGLGESPDEELSPILSAYLGHRLFYRYSWQSM